MDVVERLGFTNGATVAVVHADDIGMSHAANIGAFAALDAGPATCGSLMVPCPWFTEAAEMARLRPQVDLGVHLTLNAEFDGYRWGPVAGRTTVPSLADDAGHLYRTSRETVKFGSAADVETELRAQIDAALATGVDVTHLDSHMGTVFHPKFFAIYLALGREYHLPLFLPRIDDGLPDTVDTSAIDAEIAAMQADGFVVFDGFCANSLGFEPGTGPSHNKRRIRDLTTGLNYLICHPAQGGSELTAITASAHCRDFERQFYGGPDGRTTLSDAGVETLGMRPLRDLLRTA